jgi:CO/xanthine dehydrogenase FAD-binding subunit
MNEFDAVVAQDIEQCLSLLAERGSGAAIIAGGTDLHVLMRGGTEQPGLLIHVGNVAELGQVSETGGRISIGAALTHSALARYAADKGIDCLALAAASIGSPQVRNAATAGGNIANASPAADLYPPLLVLDAVVRLRSSRRTRDVPLQEFARGPGVSVIEPDEMITEVTFEKPAQRCFTGFIKIGLRNALAVSIASAAIYAASTHGRIDCVRIACGAVAPTPLRMKRVEALIAGEAPSAELVKQAETEAAGLCDPLSDIRSSAEYRRYVTGVIVSRLIERAFAALTP